MASTEHQKVALGLLGTSGEFVAWFRLYDDLTTKRRVRIGPPLARPTVPDLQILRVASLLKSNPQWTRLEAISGLSNQPGSTNEDVENALDIAVHATFMIDSVATRGHAADFRLGGLRPKCWAPDDKFTQFMDSSFPRTINSLKACSVMKDQDSMKSSKLAKKLKITFKATDNLSDHLLYDSQYRILYLFHHVAWLNAHLSCVSSMIPFDSNMEAAIAQGTLPPRLLFETLHSLQSILFPSYDLKAHKIMDELVKKAGFDPEFNQYNGYRHNGALISEDGMQYQYWGERLVILHDLLAERPPTTKWEKWLKWQSSDANALGIAILALVISIIVGLISIVLSVVQIWVAYLAWKRPVK